MTHQRAIEAGARALCRLLFDHGDLEKVSSPKTRSLLEKEAVELFARLAAEGLVVVPREATGGVKSAIRKFVQERATPSPSDDDPDGIYFDCGHARELYDIVITAAQQEQKP